uniref:NADH-ubiquinone oxidoreductase chain 4L n=1 Tax=Melanips sp. ZJUH 20220003 TaxID=2943452 RepID=A0A9E8G6U9_9HYME|nr:NADH dehydrogenase subunit 4L [Melanips sp. ZJUH 20220003]
MMNMMMLIIYMFFMSCLLFTTLYKHLLVSLMTLEIIMMNLMLFTYMYLLLLKFEYFLMFFLLMTVCEGVLGLTLLLLLVRFKGTDKVKLINLLMW